MVRVCKPELPIYSFADLVAFARAQLPHGPWGQWQDHHS